LAKSYLTALQVARLATDPSVGAAGQVYFNTTTNKFRGYTTLWQDLGSGSGGSGGNSGPIFVNYAGAQLANNQYFAVDSKNNAPLNPLTGDFWIVTDDSDNVPYFVATQTTAPDPTQYEFWADPSDYGGDLIYTSTSTPTGQYTGQLWIKPDDLGIGEVIVQATAPDPTQYYLWADSTDTQNLAQYAQIYNTVNDFPSATTNNGLIVSEAQFGRAYYAYNGNWIGLATASDANNLLSISQNQLTYAQYIEQQDLNTQALYWIDSGL
jgi:hypothetical protein